MQNLCLSLRNTHAQQAGALQNLCVNAANKKTVAAAGGVEALMMLLSDKDRHVKAKAAVCVFLRLMDMYVGVR